MSACEPLLLCPRDEAAEKCPDAGRVAPISACVLCLRLEVAFSACVLCLRSVVAFFLQTLSMRHPIK